jgi:serine phosphatase RsbU (regulator of sigma subunit)
MQADTNIAIDEFETEVFYGQPKQDQPPPRPCPKLVAEITERLSELTSPSALYPEVCRHLARTPKTVAVVLRAPKKTEPLPKSPVILACHFGDSPDDTTAQAAAGYYPSRLAFRISYHVLEKVRSTANAVMAKSIYSSDLEITSTIVDEHSPRAVICAPLGDVTEPVDLLYLDIPLNDTSKTTPEETFEFVRTVARETILARNRLTLMQAKAEKSILDHELSLARQIHSRLAPTIPQDLPAVELALHYKPVMWVGGDYCDFWLLKDNRLAMAIGHVNDKGLPAAIAISSLKTILRTISSFYSDPADIMKHVNTHLIQSLPQPTSATLFLGLFDSSNGSFQYANAGHSQPFIIRPQSTLMLLGQPDSPALGTAGSVFRTKVETLQPATQLIVFTDGITKIKSPSGEEFGLKRLANLLKNTAASPAKNDLRQTLAQQDDLTVLILINRK